MESNDDKGNSSNSLINKISFENFVCIHFWWTLYTAANILIYFKYSNLYTHIQYMWQKYFTTFHRSFFFSPAWTCLCLGPRRCYFLFIFVSCLFRYIMERVERARVCVCVCNWSPFLRFRVYFYSSMWWYILCIQCCINCKRSVNYKFHGIEFNVL